MRAALVIALALAACSKEDAKTEGGETKTTEGEAAPPPKAIVAVVDAWKKGGLSPGELTGAKGFGGECRSSTVDKLEVVLCDFGKPDDAKKAEKTGFEWVGDTTGAAWTTGSVVVAVADRGKADPNGKTINKLMKLSPK